jgi:hypothetical protein
VACLYADADDFSSSLSKNFCLASFLALTEKRRWRDGKPIFFLSKKARQTKSFCLRLMKNHQHQHKGKPHTHEKIQGAAILRQLQ